MANIAELGFKANTSDLDKATASLTKLKQAASGVAVTSEKLEKQVLATSLIVAKAKTDEARAILKNIQATAGASKEDIVKARTALKTAEAEQAKAKAMMTSAQATKQLEASTLTLIQAEKKQAVSRNQLALAAGGVANDKLPNRFNTANIAAQFQDIGVTASMGMNPLTIALQQGTQISAILNSMENPLRGIAAAFTSVINPISLLSIGFVAVAAGLIQVVDWTNFAINSLNGMASAIQNLGPYVLGAAAGLLLFSTPAIITGLITVTKLIYAMGVTSLVAGSQMALAWVMANPLTLLAALAAALGAFVVWAVQASKPFREFANVVIGIFLGLKDIVVGAVISMFEFLSNEINGGINALINDINSGLAMLPESIKKKLDIDGIQFNFRPSNEGLEQMKRGGETLGKTFKAGLDSELDAADYVGKIGSTVDNLLNSISGKFRGWSKGLKQDGEESPWEKLLKGAEKTLATLKAERDGINLTAEAASKLKYETQLLNEARDKGIKLGEIELSTISKLATQMASYEEQTRLLKAAKDFEESTNKKIETLKLEREAVGLSSEAAAILTYQTELLNDAREKGINLSSQEVERIKQIATGMAVFSEGTRIYKENVEFARSTTSGFFRDLKSNIQQGKSLWESFGNSVTNVLNKILDKFLDLAVNIAFDSFKPSFGNIFSGLQGGGTKPIAKFANGGAFTNSVVNKPTAFAYGGSFGVMGEAGPEAIMPLKRGSDGSLGVQLNGSSAPANSNVIVNIHNNSGATATSKQRQTSQGMEIDVMIDEIVSEKLTKEGSATNRSINMYNSRQLIKRG